MYTDHRRPKFLTFFRPLLSPQLHIAAALALISLIGATQPVTAQSESVNEAQSAAKAAPAPVVTPRAPVQVQMPAPPPSRIVPGLTEMLIATGDVNDQENKDLDTAAQTFKAAPALLGPESDFSDYAKPFVTYIDAHPNSAWNIALLTDLGLGYYHAGYYDRAFDAFGKAWQQGRDVSTPQARLLVDRAVGELARMHARLGHDKELEALLTDIHHRPVGGPATELIQGARESLWMFHHNVGMSFLCGPKALENILILTKAKPGQIKVAEDARSGSHGYTLEQLAGLADKAGLKYKLVFRKPGQPIPVPSIINWSNHHYAALTGTQEGIYLLKDPTFGDAGGSGVTAKAIDAESSGFFLVPESAIPEKSGWEIINPHKKESKSVYGMGQATTSVPGTTKPYDKTISTSLAAAPMPTDCPTCKGFLSIHGPDTKGGGKPGGKPMTVADAHAMVVSLNLHDTPLGYMPQVGLPALTTITYNQRESEQPATFTSSNLSAKWSHSWMSYIVDDPVHPGLNVIRVTAGGGGYAYPSGYNTTTGYFPAETSDGSLTFRTPATGTATTYEHDLPDGSKELFTQSDGSASYPRKMFLTSVVDSAGNTTTLSYDGTFRLTTVTDAMSRSTTFSYGLTGFPLLITQITDPFSRSSQITYDTSQRLSSITDPIGITSSFTYSSTEPTFVNSLTTPYGTSNFSDSVNPNDTVETNTRSLTIEDPLGSRDYLYFYQNPTITPSTDASGIVPTGMATNDNGFLQWRNTYYWDRHAFALGCTVDGSGNVISEDFTKAKLVHWLHDQPTTPAVGGEIGSIKPPLEHRVWMNYPGQSTYESGTLDLPTYVGRVQDSGSTQAVKTTYNSLGLPLTVTDPVGRVTKYNYDTNNIDLLTAQQLTTAPSTYTTFATYASYNSKHEPQTYTGADGKTWHYTYTAAGQINTITDPNTGVTTYNYDTSHRLSTIQNANLQTVLTLTYDSADRIQTRTDSEGYVLTYAYDNLDRVTSITYPDSTTDTFDYTFQSGPLVGTASLELRKYTDRLGRVTTYGYDADQRLTSVTEPLTSTTTRTTSYDYYENGTLKDIFDANGNDTQWTIDVESRPTAKQYAHGTSIAEGIGYGYMGTNSLLFSIVDNSGKITDFSYALDDRLTGITRTSGPNATYTYDSFWPRLATSSPGVYTYSYVPVGTNGALKLSSIAGNLTGGNDTLSFTYDALGRLATRTMSGGTPSVESFGYDAISRLQTHGTPLGSFTYTYLGQTNQVAQRSVTNGSTTVSTSWGYDTNANDRRLISITNSGVTRSYTLGYGTSPVNPYDIMSITDTAATGHPWATQSRNYTYDQSDRLLTASATTPGNDTYVYDPLDNATTVTVPSGTTNPTYNAKNQINTWGTKTYSWANGSLQSGDGTHTYTWDGAQQLTTTVTALNPSVTNTFTRDSFGRMRSDANGHTNITLDYLWCGGRICQDWTTGTGHPLQRRYFAEGELNVVTGQKLIYMPDQLGSVRDVLDGSTGSLVQSYDYTPYGAVARSNGTTPTDYQYAGLFHHAVSGLLFSTTREMDGVTGQWLNRDVITESGGINLYAYANSNPINRFDPSGLKPGDPFRRKSEAAIDVLKWINETSIAQNLEYGGQIYYDPNTDRYYASDPVCGQGSAVDPLKSKIPENTQGVGAYHTHGHYSHKMPDGTIITVDDPSADNLGSDQPSMEDYDWVRSQAIKRHDPLYTGYVGTPSHEAYSFGPVGVFGNSTNETDYTTDLGTLK